MPLGGSPPGTTCGSGAECGVGHVAGVLGKESWLQALEEVLFVHEVSAPCCHRVATLLTGTFNLRRMDMHFLADKQKVFVIRRPFRLGGCCGQPLEMDLFSTDATLSSTGAAYAADAADAAYAADAADAAYAADAADAAEPEPVHVLVGRVREDFDGFLKKCVCYCCAGTAFHSIERARPGSQGGFEPVYTIKAATWYCGRVNPCCDDMCFQDNVVFEIRDARTNTVVAHLQKTAAREGYVCGSLYQCLSTFNNYLLSFPPDASLEDRMLLVTALFQVDYQFFQARGGNDR
eukprot:TRINITY_DN4643_c0_g1_i1.p2 TRINITY_DN4643_c0_g1~~TRINITY_DN4643_c0_g1_i1.p2  ORF type:complete len:291 (+),score=59.31 TRINITY_DN4643_c0_g1_i1:257-1129(+)